jgi:enoyl-CoA hydratase
MNALSIAVRARLHAVMREVKEDSQIRFVILTGAGERAFTAGLDLMELGSDPDALSAADANGAAEKFGGGDAATAANP